MHACTEAAARIPIQLTLRASAAEADDSAADRESRSARKTPAHLILFAARARTDTPSLSTAALQVERKELLRIQDQDQSRKRGLGGGFRFFLWCCCGGGLLLLGRVVPSHFF
jgi:hypothetical protein|uniref:Uncharacterized protein n=1 Tax=Zea mays TaxID=4577 RepID=A0A804QC92_MAIZE